MPIEKESEVYCICVECNKATVFNRALYWSDVFSHWFSRYEETNETIFLEGYYKNVDVVLPVATYKCHNCSKK